jgi:hypothetical protein
MALSGIFSRIAIILSDSGVRGDAMDDQHVLGGRDITSLCGVLSIFPGDRRLESYI